MLPNFRWISCARRMTDSLFASGSFCLASALAYSPHLPLTTHDFHLDSPSHRLFLDGCLLPRSSLLGSVLRIIGRFGRQYRLLLLALSNVFTRFPFTYFEFLLAFGLHHKVRFFTCNRQLIHLFLTKLTLLFGGCYLPTDILIIAYIYFRI